MKDKICHEVAGPAGEKNRKSGIISAYMMMHMADPSSAFIERDVHLKVLQLVWKGVQYPAEDVVDVNMYHHVWQHIAHAMEENE